MYKLLKTKVTEVEEKSNDAETITVDLKNQLPKAKRVENGLENKIKKREK